MDKDVREMLGKRIRETRLKLGLTQESLGQRAGLHYSYIGQVERGNKVPSVKTLRRIAVALNIGIETLLYEDKRQPYQEEENLLIKELVNAVKECPQYELKLYLRLIKEIKSYVRHNQNIE